MAGGDGKPGATPPRRGKAGTKRASGCRTHPARTPFPARPRAICPCLAARGRCQGSAPGPTAGAGGGSRCAHGQGCAATLLPGIAEGGTSPARVCRGLPRECRACRVPRGGFSGPLPPCPPCCLGPSSASSCGQRGCASARDVPREGTLIFSWHGATQSQAESGGEAEPRARKEAQGRKLRGYLSVPSSCPQRPVGRCHPHTPAGPGAGQGRAAGTRCCVSPRHRGYIGAPLLWEKRAPGAIPKCHTLLPVHLPVSPARAGHG